MSSSSKRDHMPDGVLERLDSGGRGVTFVKDMTEIEAIRYSGDCPFWNVDLCAAPAGDENDPEGGPTVVCTFKAARLKVSRRSVPMPYSFRRVDADELHFVHRGSARFLTEMGELKAPAGRFVFITRGIAYRVIPESGDFMSLIFESDEIVSLADGVTTADVPLIQPTLPIAVEAAPGQTEWEERLQSDSWSLSVTRPFDPVQTAEVRNDGFPVFGLDIDAIPAHETEGDRRGQPFIVFRGPFFHLEIMKPSTPMPFYHRNVRANETQFVHYGSGDRFSTLGYVHAPEGALVNYPKGVSHRVGEREGPCVGLVWETHGDVALEPSLQS